MVVETHRISVQSRGNTEVLDLTERIQESLERGKVKNGIAVVFVIGSTAAITTTEFEPGLARHDLKAALERIAPEDGRYEHEATWGDDNGHSHVRASLMGASLTVPVVEGRLTLGQWQQIVLLDFDTRARRREIVVQALGE
jgi:secondary thiamine-phosphate synthase enzyme